VCVCVCVCVCVRVCVHALLGECLGCPAGWFCGAEGLVEPSGSCADGFVCLLGASVPNPSDGSTGSPCPPGMFCQQGSTAGSCGEKHGKENGTKKIDVRLCCKPTKATGNGVN